MFLTVTKFTLKNSAQINQINLKKPEKSSIFLQKNNDINIQFNATKLNDINL